MCLYPLACFHFHLSQEIYGQNHAWGKKMEVLIAKPQIQIVLQFYNDLFPRVPGSEEL